MLEHRIKFRNFTHNTFQQILDHLNMFLSIFRGLNLNKADSFRIFPGRQFSCWYFFVNFRKRFRKAFYSTSPDDFFYEADQANMSFEM